MSEAEDSCFLCKLVPAKGDPLGEEESFTILLKGINGTSDFLEM